uniref:Uncharacterized protein n=1 Tax=Nelumbo nucifera TaxID=4432 RepID=A0A822ZUM7_NELNU|nr:TPA_asm: hypothetical protein HUJ06_016992 [Nelumbo nucifera]
MVKNGGVLNEIDEGRKGNRNGWVFTRFGYEKGGEAHCCSSLVLIDRDNEQWLRGELMIKMKGRKGNRIGNKEDRRKGKKIEGRND